MKNIQDSCLDFFNNEDIRNNIKEILMPFGKIIYNEIYIYIWLFILYLIIVIIIILINLYMTMNIMKKIRNIPIFTTTNTI